MSDHEWYDITKYNLVMPQKSMIKLYNIKSISHHYNSSWNAYVLGTRKDNSKLQPWYIKGTLIQIWKSPYMFVLI